MKTLKYLFVLAVFVSPLIGCGDDDSPIEASTGDLNINFEAVFDSQPLVMNEVISLDGSDMRINVSEFYISNVQLTSLTTTQDLIDVAYVNFTEDTGPASSTLNFTDIPAGQYTELSFYIGIPAAQNAMKPEDFVSSNPLSNTANYWNGWQSYIFSKLEGKRDTNGDNDTDLTFVYHSGKNELYTRVSISLADKMDIVGDVTNNLNLQVEHKELFVKDNGYIDIEAKPTAHNPEDLEYPAIILGNFQNGITVD